MRIPALRIHKADGSAQEPLMEAEGNIQDVFADFLDVSKAVRPTSVAELRCVPRYCGVVEPVRERKEVAESGRRPSAAAS